MIGPRLAAAVLAVAAAFPAASTPTTDLRVDPPLVKPNATYPVEDVVFPEASADGAIVVSGKNIEMSADVMFGSGEADLTARARDEIGRVLGELRGGGARTVAVAGYTDDVGSEAYNLQLSQGRAESVRAELVAGLGRDVPVSATGMGEAQPIADNATEAGRALNRRVRITYA